MHENVMKNDIKLNTNQ